MKKSSSGKQLSEKEQVVISAGGGVVVASEAEDKRLLAYCRKENERLQNLIAKNQAAYESEINKLRAEHSAAMAEEANRPTIHFHGVDPKDGG